MRLALGLTFAAGVGAGVVVAFVGIAAALANEHRRWS